MSFRNVWFTSDQHIAHKNIISICNRPFSSTEEMDDYIIDTFNHYVSPNDIVYIIGDFTLGKRKDLERIQELNGEIHYIFGNHDRKQRNIIIKQPNVKRVGDILEIKLYNQSITLCHYPMIVFNKSHFGAWQLYGHVHGDISHIATGKKMNVCVDVNDYKPLSFEEVKEYMDSRENNWDFIEKN